MISTPQFSKMKDDVVIINTARGAIIDEAALVKALDDGKVSSVGLDVYEEEPKIHQGLVDNPHVMLLPHMGTWTVSTQPQTIRKYAYVSKYETQAKMEHTVVDNIRSALETGKLKSPVPEQKDMPLED